jgi:O-acetyl-ADP-ribose deacetylase (regulator of RNase III)
MGKGIAVPFRRANPAMYLAYKKACADGTLRLGGVFPWRRENGTWIYNLGTQRTWRTKAKLPDVIAALQAAVVHAERNDVASIRIPAVGAGLGGLDWTEVKRAMIGSFADVSVELVVYSEFKAGVSAVPVEDSE